MQPQNKLSGTYRSETALEQVERLTDDTAQQIADDFGTPVTFDSHECDFPTSPNLREGFRWTCPICKQQYRVTAVDSYGASWEAGFEGEREGEG